MDKAELLRIANLARLEIPDEQIEVYRSEIEKIVNFFKVIGALDTSQVVPMINPTMELATRFREDRVVELEKGSDPLLDLANEKLGNLYKVPPVL